MISEFVRKTRHCSNVASLAICLSGLAVAAAFPSSASAKDLFVAPNGSDSVSYAANDISNPWGTLDFAISNLQQGDTLYIRAGTYTPAAELDVKFVADSGTAANPVRITSYQGENVVIDLANVFRWLNIRYKSYWEISNLEFINVQVAIQINLGGSTSDISVIGNRFVMNRGSDNGGAVKVDPGAVNTVIDGNEIIGPGFTNISANAGGINMSQVSSIKVLNNRISNVPIGIHFKHENANVPGADIEFAYNYITDTSRSSIHYNGNYGYIHDNIFGQNSGAVTVGMENGQPGGHNNVFEHNTFFGPVLHLSDAGGGVQNNVVRDNVFTDRTRIMPWGTTSIHNTQLDYNMHPAGVAVTELGVDYDLAAWQSYYGGSANSIVGSPVFVGGASPSTSDGFALDPSSPGFGLASDGTDMGARVDRFGSAGLVRPNAPQSLTAN